LEELCNGKEKLAVASEEGQGPCRAVEPMMMILMMMMPGCLFHIFQNNVNVKKFRVFWDVAPCSHVEVDHNSEVSAASIIRPIISLMLEAVHTSETSVNFDVTSWHYITEDSTYLLP
jgi:hypothetical protein